MNKEIAKKWFRQAFHELEMAEKNIKIEGYDIAAFLAHQAVEKLLKSIFAVQGKKIPRIHYIDELAQKLNLPDEIINEVMDLTSDYMFARYPDVSEKVPFEEYDLKIANKKVNCAKNVFEKLKEYYEEIEQNDAK